MLKLLRHAPILLLLILPLSLPAQQEEALVQQEETLVQQEDPLGLVRSTADTVLAEVIANRESLDQDPASVYELVSEHVVPYFNFNSMTRSAMGRYWRRASNEQKEALIEEFRQLLVRTYGVALLNYSGEEITYLPLRASDNPDRATVQTRISETGGGPEIPVDYRMRRTDGNWKVHDVVIDGISLVSNYRTSFASQIRRGGIDGLIAQLVAQNNKQQG